LQKSPRGSLNQNLNICIPKGPCNYNNRHITFLICFSGMIFLLFRFVSDLQQVGGFPWYYGLLWCTAGRWFPLVLWLAVMYNRSVVSPGTMASCDLQQVGGFPWYYGLLWFTAGRWFPLVLWLAVIYNRSVVSPGTMACFTNKTLHHDITEILLKVVLNTITLSLDSSVKYLFLTNSLYFLCYIVMTIGLADSDF
jgi:hypothetical protein